MKGVFSRSNFGFPYQFDATAVPFCFSVSGVFCLRRYDERGRSRSGSGAGTVSAG